ncbi:hypothetical protein ZWY2020_041930 [Hordeum vulgare]|nr:hypothetical protein ZWY2020_041930 [Hordeum vulgare]
MLTPASSGQASTAGQRPSSASPASSGWTASGGLDGPSPASSVPATSSRPSSPASVGFSVATPLSGHPASLPATAICYLPRSQECGLADGDFSVHRRAPEDFLVRFKDPSLRARVATTRVRTPRFRLIFHPWGRSAGSEPVKALFLVSLELFGVPDHAWHRSAAETLLSLFCKIEHLAPETWNMSDMSVFKLAAWTINPDAIPRSSELLVQDDDAVDLDADPDRVERFALGLDYRRPSPPPPLPPSAGDAGLGQALPLSPYVGRSSMTSLPPSRTARALLLVGTATGVVAVGRTRHRRAAFRLVS